jgi:hypothetical protein
MATRRTRARRPATPAKPTKRTATPPNASRSRPASPVTSLRAYANHRHVSVEAVRKAISGGRLQRSIVLVDGVPQVADVALADQEWSTNTDLSRAHDDVKRRAAAASPPASNIVLFPPPAGDSMAAASAAEKHWRAKKAELDYKRAAGELVDAAEIKGRIVEIFTTCRSKLLGLPTKAKQRLPHLTITDVNVLDDVVRESLEELVPGRVSV